MALDQGGGPGWAVPGYQMPVGSYARLLRRQCERECAPDARHFGEPDWAKWKAAGAIKAATMYDERLAAAAPIVVGAMDCGIRDSRVADTLRLYSDDFAEVASVYSGEMDDAGRWELVTLAPRYRPARA
ncbi:Mycobacterium numidiamassiliense ORFan [Mycobacterium numidiamassiliense]|uniref:Mycobacterium numidiamassiliense ORFan n=1 Tax=Mycobacterium numidiamassiliense TaxID=1841861 RepID=A0A2U3PHV1_9MYCO|nr:hypothetical protein [Mycobacterium numidiamassiliense]SPM43348.1 Mycobacterium numidiamassiliense ORFan [Mycobacterium numidiamassiliense]